MTESTYQVAGMTCEHCVRAVTGELEGLPGVRGVRIDLATGAVTVAADAPLAIDEVRGAVEEAGYALVASGA
jgi:copper chaperone CopZ